MYGGLMAAVFIDSVYKRIHSYSAEVKKRILEIYGSPSPLGH
jgi:hypothetical protein